MRGYRGQLLLEVAAKPFFEHHPRLLEGLFRGHQLGSQPLAVGLVCLPHHFLTRPRTVTDLLAAGASADPLIAAAGRRTLDGKLAQASAPHVIRRGRGVPAFVKL